MLALSVATVVPAGQGPRARDASVGVLSAATWAPAVAAAESPALQRAGSGRSRVGFSPGFSIMDLSPAALRRDMRGMRRIGARRIRIDLSWARVQPAKGTYDWRDTDRVFKAARAEGLKILALLSYEPDWARRYDAQGVRRPVSPKAFARFAGRAARRYAPMVEAWEIWNEPNLERFWSSGPDATAYAALVDAVAPVLQRRDPSATVLAGALSPGTDAADGSQVSPVTFLARFYAASKRPGAVDAISVHPYSYPALPTGGQEWNTFHRLLEIRRVMTAAGAGRQRIWLTEYGAPTGRHSRAVTATRQGRMLVMAQRLARSVSYLGPIYFYSYRDTARAPFDLESNFGIVRENGTRKPSYYSLARALRTTKRKN